MVQPVAAQPHDGNLARKRVRVDSVLMLPSENKIEQKPVGYPSLLSFPSSMNAEQREELSMEMVKRRRTEGKPEPNLQPEKHELIAQYGTREWRAQKCFTDMNQDYFIGVRHKQTDTIQLFEVDGMYTIRPYVKRKDPDDELQEDENVEALSYREQRNELLKTFGGKRSLQRVEKYEKDRITDNKLDEKAQIQVSEAAQRMKEKDAKDGITHLGAETTESLAPPHDNNASEPEGAYPLQGLITPGELAALEKEVTAMIEMCSENVEAVENPGWNPLVWDALVSIARDNSISDVVRVQRMQAAMHLHYLIVLSRCSNTIFTRDLHQLMEDMAVDRSVLQCLLERFTVPHSADGPNVRRKSSADSTRIVIYSIVMWITATGFENCGRLAELAQALGVSPKLLIKYALQIGCKVRRKGGAKDVSGYQITLKVPLVFPAIRKRTGMPQRRS